MNESKDNRAVADEELIGVLTAISVVSKRLARQLIREAQTSQSKEGGENRILPTQLPSQTKCQ